MVVQGEDLDYFPYKSMPWRVYFVTQSGATKLQA